MVTLDTIYIIITLKWKKYHLWKKTEIFKYKFICISGAWNKNNFALACNHNRQRQVNTTYFELKYLHQRKIIASRGDEITNFEYPNFQ